MIETHMKREEELVSLTSEDLIASLKYQIASLPLREINRPTLNEALRQCEFLRIAIQAKLVSHVN